MVTETVRATAISAFASAIAVLKQVIGMSSGILNLAEIESH